MDRVRLTRKLTDPPTIPAESAERVQRLLETGLLFRYGEFSGDEADVSHFEDAFADHVHRRYAIAVNSGGGAMFVALKALDVQPSDSVLFNAFTLAPVPGSIAHAGAKAVPVAIDQDLRIDMEDLQVAAEQTGARILMLSHMRGHICDMDRLTAICDRLGISIIEDCAHTLGGFWQEHPSGHAGVMSCYSAQAYKHINGGEGGIVVTDDDDLAARAILLSGSYRLYAQNGRVPPLDTFKRHLHNVPNCSLRMNNITASLLTPQLSLLAERRAIWQDRYLRLQHGLIIDNRIALPERPKNEIAIPSSFQFRLPSHTNADIAQFCDRCAKRGLPLKWFGAPDPSGFTATFKDWHYVDQHERPALTHSLEILRSLIDIRVPLTLTIEDCTIICTIIREELDALAAART